MALPSVIAYMKAVCSPRGTSASTTTRDFKNLNRSKASRILWSSLEHLFKTEVSIGASYITSQPPNVSFCLLFFVKAAHGGPSNCSYSQNFRKECISSSNLQGSSVKHCLIRGRSYLRTNGRLDKREMFWRPTSHFALRIACVTSARLIIFTTTVPFEETVRPLMIRLRKGLQLLVVFIPTLALTNVPFPGLDP